MKPSPPNSPDEHCGHSTHNHDRRHNAHNHDKHRHSGHSHGGHSHGEHSHSGHSHGGHNHGGDSNIGVAFFLNLAFTVIELAGGLFTNSVAIISDAVHDFGDSLSLGLAWYFQRLSKKGSNRHYTYGYKRFSLLGAIINAVVLVAGSAYILIESVPRLFAPQATNAAGMFVLAIIGIIINGAAVLRTRQAGSINERVVSLHLLEDVLGWAAVLVGSAIMYFTGLAIIDPILSIIIAFFVLVNVFRNIRDVLPILLQSTPAEVDREHLIAVLDELEQIDSLHDLHIWSLDEEYNVLTVHVILAGNLTLNDLGVLKATIRKLLADENIQHATIEFETHDEACDLADCI